MAARVRVAGVVRVTAVVGMHVAVRVHGTVGVRVRMRMLVDADLRARACGVVLMPVRVMMRIRPAGEPVLVHEEARGGDARPQGALGADVVAVHGEAAQRGAQPLERQARVEERPEEHVPRDAGEPVDIEHTRH